MLDAWEDSGENERLAWCAGFADGKGYFAVNSRGYRVVSVEHADPLPLFRLVEMFGGRVQFLGQRLERSAPVWRWRVYGRKARDAAARMSPWLTTKRAEAEMVALSEFYPAGSELGGTIRDRAEAVKEWRRKWGRDGQQS